VEDGHIRFTLPFMEAYLLAKRLTENPPEAAKYFTILSEEFDHGTFAIYAEMGASWLIVRNILKRLDLVIKDIASDGIAGSILMDPAVTPTLLERQDRFRSVQNMLRKAAADVRSERDQSKEKQTLLDVSDRMRENAGARVSAIRSNNAVGKSGTVNAVDEAAAAWSVAITLLGSGAERLEAGIKRDLIKKVVNLSGLIIDRRTRAHHAVDFEDLKKEMLKNKELVASLAKSKSEADLENAMGVIRSIADLLQYIHMMQPFILSMAHLCEEARDHVLAESIANTNVENGIEELLRDLWLSDINVPKGRKGLMRSIKSLPKSKFFRNAITVHLMSRVFWKHWRTEDRLSLLDAADISLRGVGQQYKTGELQRIIEKLPDTEIPED